LTQTVCSVISIFLPAVTLIVSSETNPVPRSLFDSARAAIDTLEAAVSAERNSQLRVLHGNSKIVANNRSEK